MNRRPSIPPSRWPLLIALALVLVLIGCQKSTNTSEQFTRLTNLGKSQYEAGDAGKAIDLFRQALALNPALPEAQLNLANAYLLANQSEQAIRQARQILEADRASAAAHYIIGCAHLRLGQTEEALKSLQQSHRLDPAVTALNFQIALAHERLGQTPEAMAQLQTVTEFEPEHPAAHYRLSQLLQKLGRKEEAAAALAAHQAVLAKQRNAPSDAGAFERCKHTQARVVFQLEEPLPEGIKVTFSDNKNIAHASGAAYHGPMAAIDLAHDGRNSLFVCDGAGFRLLVQSNGMLVPAGTYLPGLPDATYRQGLSGDLQNDRTEDVVMLSDKGCQVFKFTTNGQITDVTSAAGLGKVAAADGVLMDFDYTGKLGLVALPADGQGVRVFRNLSSTFAMYFSEQNVTSGLPAEVTGVSHLLIEDWNNDEMMDVMLTRAGQAPLVFARQRGGPFAATNLDGTLPASAIIASADFNNDGRPDLVAAGVDKLEFNFAGHRTPLRLPLEKFKAAGLTVIDFDNDGWRDLVVFGDGLRAWRNLGRAGFREVTATLGFDKTIQGKVKFVTAADFDSDCDTDMVIAVEETGLQFLRNDGGSAHRQLKLRLVGNRSNASGLGVRFEVTAGGLRSWHAAGRLPIEIGVGRHKQVDSVSVRWFDGFINHDDIKVDRCDVLALDEIEKPTGSCPYLFAWDGTRFRFVTDLLGAAPLGLRLSDTRFIDADPVEIVRIGDEATFPPRAGRHVLQITEELREVFYLDEAKLMVVDHPAGTEVHSTSKLVPGKPFPAHGLLTLHQRQPLRSAVNHDGADVAAALAEVDGRMVSPTKLRERQLRGLAEPHRVMLDFGPLDPTRPLVLALTGWLRFGGGMANVGAALTPELPFPFPTLEAEIPKPGGPAVWQKIEVVVGAPAGKTKTILTELTGKLPPGSRRLRVSSAFEVHWDRIALFDRRDSNQTRVVTVTATKSDLHWRGYSEFAPGPWTQPLTPDYTNAQPTANWTITPAGWCTRYGAVDELIGERDNALVLINGGDELTLEFATDQLPPKPAGTVRDFFLVTAGWDKDADFHCELGSQVEPLPWHGMDSQRYGREVRPAFPNDDWMKRYNTRWVGPYTLTKRRP